MSYGKEGCARVKSKIVLILGSKLFIIIIMVWYTLEQRIFLYDEYVKCVRVKGNQFQHL